MDVLCLLSARINKRFHIVQRQSHRGVTILISPAPAIRNAKLEQNYSNKSENIRRRRRSDGGPGRGVLVGNTGLDPLRCGTIRQPWSGGQRARADVSV